MSYTDLRDFEAEYTLEANGYTIAVEKLGGGTLGRRYDGTWRYVVTDPTGDVVAQGQDLFTGTPKSHGEAAEIVVEFILAGE